MGPFFLINGKKECHYSSEARHKCIYGIHYKRYTTSENKHTKGAQTWTPQNENNTEGRESFYSQTHLISTTICKTWNTLTYDLVQCDSFYK
jgi:hypothetical protein